MNIVFKIFKGIRQGVEYLSKATKVLKSIEKVSEHVNKLVDDLEKIWEKDINKAESAQTKGEQS